MSAYTIAGAAQAEIEIRKSRFLGFIIPVNDRDGAMTELYRLREEHRLAAHVCWALLAGGHSGMSDDGEPSGTAGRPILDVLRHHELEGVLAAVVRYYGGIKLGAGGLVRAYTDAIASALVHAQRIERIVYSSLGFECGYADEARVRRWLEKQNYGLIEAKHGETVSLLITLPASAIHNAKAELCNLTHARVRFDDPDDTLLKEENARN